MREKAHIDEVISQYVTLRNAGGGSHEGPVPVPRREDPVLPRPAQSKFIPLFRLRGGRRRHHVPEKIDGLSFVEAVERLADKYGVELQARGRRRRRAGRTGPPRGRLIEANRLAQEYYAEQLLTPAAQPARQFLTERGFDGLGRGAVRARLRAPRRRGPAAAPAAAGVHRGRARRRRAWSPSGVRRTTGSAAACSGRSARPAARPSASGRGGSSTTTASTPSTSTPRRPRSTRRAGCSTASTSPARRSALTSQAVVVEGYTDVMACHLAGVGTAVASCGTAFGDDHAKVLRRYMADHEEFRGEVIFTFDGDEAGQKAAVKAFDGRPELRLPDLRRGRARRPRPLRPPHEEGRRRGPRAGRPPGPAIPLRARQRASPSTTSTAPTAGSTRSARARGWCSSIRDRSKVDAFAREIASMIGVDVEEARTEVRRAASRSARPVPAGACRGPGARQPSRPCCRTSATRGSRSSGRRSSSSSSTRWPSVAPLPTSASTTSPTRPTAPSGSSSRPPAGPVAGAD